MGSNDTWSCRLGGQPKPWFPSVPGLLTLTTVPGVQLALNKHSLNKSTWPTVLPVVQNPKIFQEGEKMVLVDFYIIHIAVYVQFFFR